MITKLILLGIVSSVTSQSLHHMMSPEDLKNVFSVENVDEVPAYEVLPISITKPRTRRMANTFLVQLPIGNQLRMWLNPLDGVLASEDLIVNSARYNPNSRDRLYLQNRPYPKQLLSRIYHNYGHATTVAVNNRGRRQTLQGYVGQKLIQPVPPHLEEHAKRHRRSLNQSVDLDSEDHVYHIAYDIPQPMKNMDSHSIQLPSTTNSTRSKRYAAPSVIYPEILVIVERSLMQRMGQTPEQQLLYVLAFWNGVDMRYRSLANPRVRLNIARIIFAEDDHVLPYLMPRNSQYFRLYKERSLDNQGRWLYQVQGQIPLNSYDAAMTMLPHTMCDSDTQCMTLGYAYISEACRIIPELGLTRKVAFAQDKGAFDGIQTAAHELGHLFGIRHDGDYNNCQDAHGYIMTTYDKFTPHAFDWSPCSIQQMDNFFKSRLAASCLYTQPRVTRPILRFLPGQVLDANRQCQMLGTGQAAVIDDSICVQLKCTGRDILRPPEAAEGTTCGQQKICIHGRCIHESYVN